MITFRIKVINVGINNITDYDNIEKKGKGKKKQKNKENIMTRMK